MKGIRRVPRTNIEKKKKKILSNPRANLLVSKFPRY